MDTKKSTIWLSAGMTAFAVVSIALPLNGCLSLNESSVSSDNNAYQNDVYICPEDVIANAATLTYCLATDSSDSASTITVNFRGEDGRVVGSAEMPVAIELTGHQSEDGRIVDQIYVNSPAFSGHSNVIRSTIRLTDGQIVPGYILGSAYQWVLNGDALNDEVGDIQLCAPNQTDTSTIIHPDRTYVSPPSQSGARRTTNVVTVREPSVYENLYGPFTLDLLVNGGVSFWISNALQTSDLQWCDMNGQPLDVQGLSIFVGTTTLSRTSSHSP